MWIIYKTNTNIVSSIHTERWREELVIQEVQNSPISLVFPVFAWSVYTSLYIDQLFVNVFSNPINQINNVKVWLLENKFPHPTLGEGHQI